MLYEKGGYCMFKVNYDFSRKKRNINVNKLNTLLALDSWLKDVIKQGNYIKAKRINKVINNIKNRK